MVHTAFTRAALGSLTLGAFICTLALSQPLHAEEPIRIGVLTDMTGNVAVAAGKGSVEAAQMAIDDFKARTPGAHPVELISADYQSRPDLARHISEDWITRQDVDVVVDVPNATITARLQDFFKSSDRLMLTSCPLISPQSSCEAQGLSWLYSLDVLANNLARALVLENKKNWFIISSDDPYSRNLAAVAQKQLIALGGKVTGEAELNRRMVGLDMVLQQVKPDKTDIIFLAFDRHDLLHMLKSWPADAAKVPLAISAIYTSDVRAMTKDTPPIYTLSSFYWDQDAPTRKWSEEFARRSQGNMPSNIHASVYSSVKLYLQAVQALGQQHSAQLLQYMKTHPLLDGPFGASRIRPDGVVVHRMLLMRSKPVEARTTQWDNFTIVRTLSPQELLLPEEADCKAAVPTTPVDEDDDE